MAATYIIYSKSIDTFYIGSCFDFKSRLEEHNSKFYKNAFTSRANDWEEYFVLEDISEAEARFLESFIKRMRNRNFYAKLSGKPELGIQIINDKM